MFVAEFQIDGIEHAYLVKMYDMFEIPTDKNVYLGHGCGCDMYSVIIEFWSENISLLINIGQRKNLFINFEYLRAESQNFGIFIFHLLRSILDFRGYEFRNNRLQFAESEVLYETV